MLGAVLDSIDSVLAERVRWLDLGTKYHAHGWWYDWLLKSPGHHRASHFSLSFFHSHKRGFVSHFRGLIPRTVGSIQLRQAFAEQVL